MSSHVRSSIHAEKFQGNRSYTVDILYEFYEISFSESQMTSSNMIIPNLIRAYEFKMAIRR